MPQKISNVAQRVDIVARQNAVLTFEFTFLNADGSPKSVAGETIELSIRKSRSSNDPLLTLSTATGEIDIGGASNNEVTVTMTKAQSAALPCGCWVYDCDRSSNGIPVCAGSFEVVEDR